MDKDQKEKVGKILLSAREKAQPLLKKAQPHLTMGKGLVALGVGVVFYGLSQSGSTQNSDPIASKDSQVTQKAEAIQKTTSVVAEKSTASKSTASGVPDSVVKARVVKAKEATKAETKKAAQPSQPTEKDEAEKKVTFVSPSLEKKTNNKAAEGNGLSNFVVVDDKTQKTTESKTVDELSKWASQSENKTAQSVKSGSEKPEEQDVMGNAPVTLEDPSDKDVLAKKAQSTTDGSGLIDTPKASDKKTDLSKNPIAKNPIVSPLIEPIDKNAATGLADAEPENPRTPAKEMPALGGVGAIAEADETGNKSAGKTSQKVKKGLLSAPLSKDVEDKIISKFEKSAKTRKKTGLLSAPATEQSLSTEPEGLLKKQSNDTMNEGASMKTQSIKAEAGKAPSQAKAHVIKKSSKSNVSEFTLSNGMDVIVIPDHRAPVVTHMVWYKVGAVDEPMGKSGIAHFLEHLMFKGTHKIASGEFSKIIAKNGGQDNAFTSMDTTAYHERVSKDRLRMVMEMEADRMRNLTLSEKDVLTERDVILEERRSRTDNKPSAQFREQMESALYMNHPYGMPIIGWLHEMKTLSREDALQFYRRFYAPNNAVLVVAGDVSVEEVEKLASEIYEPIKAEETVVRKMRAQEPPHRAARRLTMRHDRVAKAQWQRYYLAPGYSDAKEGEVEALDLLFKILGDSTTGRLYKSMVVRDKIAENAGGYYTGDSLDSGKMIFYSIAGKGVKLSAVEAAIDKEIALVKEKGVTQKELDAARNAYSAAYVYANDNQVSLANRYGGAKVRGRTVAQVEGWPDMLKKVTIEDIQKVAQKYLTIEKSVTGELLPDETKKAATKEKAKKG